MKRIFSILAGLALTALTVQAENTLLPTCGLSGSIAPYVDKDGYVDPVVPLGNIDFGNGLTLPLTLDFSSKVRPPSPEFGQGWECPLFESRVYDVQDGLKKVELFTGSTIYMVYNKRIDAWKHYYSNAWTGKVQGDDFVLTYYTGAQFIFHKGLMSELTMPNGRTILWNRSGDKVISLGESGKLPALVLHYDSLGFAKQMLLNPDSLGASKKVFDLSADLAYAAVDKITCPGGRSITMAQSRDKALNPVLAWADTSRPAMTLGWDRKTGLITSDGKFSYQIKELSKDNSAPEMFRTDKLTCKTESYHNSPSDGILDKTLLDGTKIHEETILTPGPTYRIVRLLQETKKGVTHDLLRRSFDDQGHLLLEATGLANGKEQVKQYLYDDAGHVVSYLFNGKEMWKNVFDVSTGRLKERIVTSLGVTMEFDPLPAGQVKESIERLNSKVISTQLLDSDAWQRTVDSMQRID